MIRTGLPLCIFLSYNVVSIHPSEVYRSLLKLVMCPISLTNLLIYIYIWLCVLPLTQMLGILISILICAATCLVSVQVCAIGHSRQYAWVVHLYGNAAFEVIPVFGKSHPACSVSSLYLRPGSFPWDIVRLGCCPQPHHTTSTESLLGICWHCRFGSVLTHR